MSNPANLGIKQPDGHTIWLYQHWVPEKLLASYAKALEAARPRWNDPAYGTRILISQIIGSNWDSEYGFGISVDRTYLADHKAVLIDMTNQTVSILDQNTPNKNAKPLVTFPFDKFVKRYNK
jgi:hypothetical protein